MYPRYAVVDWGFLRNLTKGAAIATEWQLLLPDILFHEVIDVESPDSASAFWRKAVSFVDDNRSRIWGTNYWVYIAKDCEKRFERRAGIENVIDRVRTRALRQLQSPTDAELASRITAYHKTQEYAMYKSEQRNFVEHCDGYVTYLRKEPPPRDERLQTQWIQNPDLVAQLITSPGALSRRFPRMQARHVTGFPDRWALARWTRITMWYALQRWNQGNNPSADFKNNFDDAQYLFLASYAGHLATRDRGLKKATQVLFPGCRIVDFGIS